jgi:hypothetical protein
MNRRSVDILVCALSFAALSGAWSHGFGTGRGVERAEQRAELWSIVEARLPATTEPMTASAATGDIVERTRPANALRELRAASKSVLESLLNGGPLTTEQLALFANAVIIANSVPDLPAGQSHRERIE